MLISHDHGYHWASGGLGLFLPGGVEGAGLLLTYSGGYDDHIIPSYPNAKGKTAHQMEEPSNEVGAIGGGLSRVGPDGQSDHLNRESTESNSGHKQKLRRPLEASELFYQVNTIVGK